MDAIILRWAPELTGFIGDFAAALDKFKKQFTKKNYAVLESPMLLSVNPHFDAPREMLVIAKSLNNLSQDLRQACSDAGLDKLIIAEEYFGRFTQK